MSSEETGGSVELRRKICEAVERTMQLEAKRRALAEIRDGLDGEARELQHRLMAVQREHGELRAQLDERTKRIEEIEVELRATEQDVGALERQCAANVRRAERTARAADALIEEMRATEGMMSAGELTLDGVRASVARMDRKLGAAERKRGGVESG